MAEFEKAWNVMHESVTKLTDSDLQATITIHHNPLLVDDALLRSVAHFASHAGAIRANYTA